ncbi:MAG: PfkB family carbohydrate kinase [Candidatus Omnitrophota bacterium]
MSTYKGIIAKFKTKKVLVVGDIILDRYIQGSVSRISPEAPVPIVLEEKSSYQPGGAANVGHNLAVLGAEVVQVGRIGSDFEGQLLKRAIKNKDIDISGIFIDKHVSTITKTRVIAQHQQVVRIDKEDSGADIQDPLLNKIKSFLQDKINKVDAVIISDYGKGMITPELVTVVTSMAIQNGIPVTVDPKVEHFGCYKRVTCITPNLKEAENAIRNIKIREDDGHILGLNNDKLMTMEDIETAGDRLLKYLNSEALLITLGEQGMRLFEKGRKPYGIETKAQEVFDVTGAGDAVISVFTLALTAGATRRQAAELANYAAGIVVGKMGAAAATPTEILQAVKA